MYAAFGGVWSALAFADRRPASLRPRAAGLIVAMRRHGSYAETAYRMSDADVAAFAADLARFAAEAEAAAGRPPRPGVPVGRASESGRRGGMPAGGGPRAASG